MDPLYLTIEVAVVFVVLAVVVSVILKESGYLKSKQKNKQNTSGKDLTTNGHHTTNGHDTTNGHYAGVMNNGNESPDIRFRRIGENGQSSTGESCVNSDLGRIKSIDLLSKVTRCGNISYNINDLIQRRDSSVVYKGMFKDKIDVAVKLVFIQYESDLIEQDNELKGMLDTLDSGGDHVVQYYSIERIVDKANLYLTTASELCRWNLTQFIKSGMCKRVLYRDACKQMLEGLQYLHKKGVLHRNMLPSNVLVTQLENEFVFKLSDFGNPKRPRLFGLGTDVQREYCSDGWVAPEVYDNASACDTTISSFKITEKADIFSMGLVCAYYKTSGKNLFDTQVKIQKNNANMWTLEGDMPFQTLIRQMTQVTSKFRPSVYDCMKHPAFWDSETKLKFYVASSNFIQSDDGLTKEIEKDAMDVVNFSWKSHLSRPVKGYIFSTTRRRGGKSLYCEYSVRFLLRAIRNLMENFKWLPLNVQEDLGASLDAQLNYWTHRFPNLLMYVYVILKPKSSSFTDELKQFF